MKKRKYRPITEHERIRQLENKEYHTSRWRKLSLAIRKERGFCEHCLIQGRYRQSELVDHIKPVKFGGDMWDTKNLQALCQRCHNDKSAIDGSLAHSKKQGHQRKNAEYHWVTR